jgi:hypothetical protein
MKKNELNIIVTISIFSAIIIGIMYLWLISPILDVKNGFRAISSGVTFVTFFWGLYFKWGWKMFGLKSLFYRPNLNGTWAGEIISDWVDKNGKIIKPKTIFIVVRQNFLTVNITTFTDNFIGKSYSETLTLNKFRGVKNLAYLYRKETSYSGDNKNNEGATELRLIESDVMKLEGKYWSNIKTNGSLKLNFISEKKVDSYEDALKL